MTGIEQLQSLMMEFGPAAGDVAAVVQKDEGQWAIALPDDTAIVAD